MKRPTNQTRSFTQTQTPLEDTNGTQIEGIGSKLVGQNNRSEDT